MKKIDKEIDLVKQLIKLVEKDWTVDKCKGYHPACANCQGQLFLGMLYDHLDQLEWQKKNEKDR